MSMMIDVSILPPRIFPFPVNQSILIHPFLKSTKKL